MLINVRANPYCSQSKIGFVTYDEITKIGLEFADVVDTMAWGTPALKRKKAFMIRLKEDGESIVVRLDWDNHDRLLASRPNVFFKTPHYDAYNALLVRLDDLNEDLAREIVEYSWLEAPNKQVRRPT